MTPSARLARIASLENMVTISSNTLVAMASQLSEAEERERAFAGHGRWSQLRSMGEAKNLLHYIFNVAADARLYSMFFLVFSMMFVLLNNAKRNLTVSTTFLSKNPSFLYMFTIS